MSGWQFELLRTDGTQLSDLPEARDRKVTFKLNGPTEVKFALPGSSYSASVIEELNTDVLVLYDGQALARCRIGATSDELDEDRHDLDVAGVDYLSLLDRRYVHVDYTYTNVPLVDIAWDLIDLTQHRTGWAGGELGITRGLRPTSSPNVTHTTEAGAKIGELIDTLHEISPGFDYEIDAGLHFNQWSFRGIKRDFALEYGGNVSKVTRTIDPAEYANAIRQSGADGVPATWLAAPDLATRPEGRFEMQEGNTDLDNATLVQWAAEAYLQRHGTLLPSYDMTLAPAAGWNPTLLWLGDTATVVIRSGRLDVLAEERVTQLDIDVTNDGAVDVTVGFGDWRQDLLQWFRTLPDQIQKINRR